MASKNLEGLVDGEELFGSRLPEEWHAQEQYTEENARLIKLMIESKKLSDGGPAVELDELIKLRIERVECQEVEDRITKLLGFKNWFRYNYILNLAEDRYSS